MNTSKYCPSAEDLKLAAELADIDLAIHETNEDYRYEAEEADAQALLEEMGKVAFSDTGDGFASFVARNRERIFEASWYDDRVAELLVLGYKMGIGAGSGACMNDLGALYYMGEIVEQDYAKAAELYEMAMEHGCYQSIINLGYIYEYGRTGDRDLAKAHRFYALAAALTPSSEAVYKLGDMYSRGITGEKDLPKARALWEHSLELAAGIVEIAQPAIRIAKLLISPDSLEAGIEPDPMRALELFQQAEIGLRIDITQNGMTYYKKRLQEAIEGQAQARAMIDEQDEEELLF